MAAMTPDQLQAGVWAKMMGGKQDAPPGYKPSWASLSSTAAPSAANSWGNSSQNTVEHEDFSQLLVPAGLPTLGEDGGPTNMAAENARLAAENELLRMQCMQAAQAAAAAAQVAAAASVYNSGYPQPPPGSFNQWGAAAMPPGSFAPPGVPKKRGSGAKPSDARPRLSSSASQGRERAESGASAACVEIPDGPKTTVMVRNLPNNFSRQSLQDLLDKEGFEKQYDFIYLPIDFKSNASLGYAFVNLATPEVAERFWEVFQGFSKWNSASQKVCSVNWAAPTQGLDSHIERFRNSPVMHESVPDEHKPIMLDNGDRKEFPPPTKKIRPPRVRPGRGGKGHEGGE